MFFFCSYEVNGTKLLPTAVAWFEIAVAGFARAALGDSK
jgi:hypothetical protein